MYIIGEIVQVHHKGKWYDAEILDVTNSGVYAYIYDLQIKVNVTNANIR